MTPAMRKWGFRAWLKRNVKPHYDAPVVAPRDPGAGALPRLAVLDESPSDVACPADQSYDVPSHIATPYLCVFRRAELVVALLNGRMYVVKSQWDTAMSTRWLPGPPDRVFAINFSSAVGGTVCQLTLRK